MADLSDEAEAFLTVNPDVKTLDAFIIDLCGNPVGKRYPATDIPKLFSDGSTMCAAMQLTDAQGVSWDTLGYGFSDGDPDCPCWPVPGTLRPVPWASEPRAQCLMRLTEADRTTPIWFEPRTVLERVVAHFADLGLKPVVALELEFYLIDRERNGEGGPQHALLPGQGGIRSSAGQVFNMSVMDAFAPVVDAIAAACKDQGVPVTTIAKEYGVGQFEFNLAHLSDPVAAADHGVLQRRIVREVARVQGYDATFMSKPFAEDSGSGLQVNLSIQDSDGNIFDPRRTDGDARLGHAIAGMQAMLAESFAIFAPNLNAYRRFEPDQFTPVTSDWGENNRSVAFRVPASDPENRRIEHRAAGAEANPYLVTAAVLAAAHHGLTNTLTPTAEGTGNVGAEIDPSMPLQLWTALDRFQAAKVLPDYFGARYIEAYAHVKQSEFESFMTAILPREHAWYL
ncbi:MAG: glutamine synthetase family protein [Pseudomonadota bacterium]